VIALIFAAPPVGKTASGESGQNDGGLWAAKKPFCRLDFLLLFHQGKRRSPSAAIGRAN
jgi:hypothetical protein